MNQYDKRQTALGAVRSEIRHNGYKVKDYTSVQALAVLDDMARQYPNLTACQWYINASNNQIKLFEKEWGK